MMEGKLNEASEDFGKEIDTHPEEDRAYILLAEVQRRQLKSSKAIDTLHKLLAVNPDSKEGNMMLAALLTKDNDMRGAETALRRVMSADSQNEQVKVLLGNVLLREGKKTEGEPLLKDVLEKTQDAGMLNNAAYELADGDLDLPLAEEAARKSISLQQEQMVAAGEGSSERAMLQRTSLLIATWDTFGWILYREGKYAEAEPWIRAAWGNGPNDELGLHLGMLLLKLNRPKEAEEAFDLATKADPGANSISVQQQIESERSALRKAGIPVQVSDARQALQSERTYRLPRGTSSINGAATVEFELTRQGAANPRMVEGENGFNSLLTGVSALDFKAAIPAGSEAKLTRRGVLSCHSGSTCMFVLMSPGSALLDVR